MTNTLARMRQLIGSPAAWASNDLVLGNGEIAAELQADNSTKLKVGNGVLRYSQLPYVASGSGGTIDVSNPITVTNAITLTASALGKEVILADAGSPANYLVYLPANAPINSMVYLRVARTATKIYVLNGNDVNIDGVPTRNLWRGETALLKREANGWTKLSGVTIPFSGGLLRSTSQTIVVNTQTQVSFDQAFGDPTGLNLCYGGTNFVCPRPGVYQFHGGLSIGGTGISGNAQWSIQKASGIPATPPTIQSFIAGTWAAGIVMQTVSGAIRLALSDAVGLVGYISAGTALSFDATAAHQPTLTFAEVPTW